MSPSDPTRDRGPSSLAPEALAALGKLRECVSAARNLEHLIGARDVGPKALEQMVPDVIAELEPFGAAVVELSAFICSDLRLPSATLDALVDSAHQKTAELLNALRGAQGASMNAKRRLSMERSIRATLPPISSTLSQVELLVEATSQSGVPMSVHELLSSAPDSGSNRPYRQVLVSGDTMEMFVSIPARIGLRCLGMVASAADPEGRSSLQLSASQEDDEVRLSFAVAINTDGVVAKLPVYPHTPHSLTAVRAALQGFGGHLLAEESGFTLPRALP